MRRFRLLLEYDGSDFAGFQRQGKGERTVQETLESAIWRLSGSPCVIHGAGRTDAGVHASGQVVHFDSAWPIPVDRMAFALNGELPTDLCVKAATETTADFHARFSATGRTYRYVILNRTQPSALLSRFALHVRGPLDLDAMRLVAQNVLIGTHDFTAFGLLEEAGKSGVRQVRRLDIRPWRDCVLITVEGNAFLRQMVRAFAGTLIRTGQHRLTAQAAIDIRNSRDRRQCPLVAPARGLCLTRVTYTGKRLT